MPIALLLAQASVDAPDLLAAARARTAAETRCAAADPSDVTVCGRRAADRFRVTFVEPNPKDAVLAQ